MDEDLHRRRRDADLDAARVALVDELHRPLLREVGVGDDDLVGAVLLDDLADVVERAQRRQAVVGPRVQRHEADDRVRVAAAIERVGDRLDVLAGADEHGAALVAGATQHPAARPLVDEPQRADVGDREQQRAVEDVEALELVVVDDREDGHDDHRLKQRRHDPRQAGAGGAIGVQARARKQQRRHEVGERHVVLGLVGELARVPLVRRRGLDGQRGQQRPVDGDEIERQQDRDPRQRADRGPAQDEAQRRRATAADVVLGQDEVDGRRAGRRDRRLLRRRFGCPARRSHLTLPNGWA